MRRFDRMSRLVAIVAAIVVVAAILLPSLPAVAGDAVSHTIDVNGVSRDYLLYVPPGQSGKLLPAFIVLHGSGSTDAQQETYSNFDAFAQAHGLVVMYPQGIDKHWNDGRVIGHESAADDIGFMKAMLAEVTAQGLIDPKRVYLTGLSMGGFGALKCGLSHPELYAGCASFSGVGDLSILLGEYQTEDNIGEMRGTFGPELIVKARDDLRLLANQAGSLPREQRPRVLITCGTRDFLHESNRELRDYLRSLPLDFRYEEWEGDHEWGFWDKSVQIALEEFFPENA